MKNDFSVMRACFVGLALCAGSASAGVFSASQTIDPWPDSTIPSSDLETVMMMFDVPDMAFGDATLTLDVMGDFNGVDEYLDVSVDGFSLGRLFDGNTGNDAFDLATDDPGSVILSSQVTASATISLADLSGLIGDGMLVFTFDPTEAQQPGQGVPASITATISYAIPAPGTIATLFGGLALASRRRR